MKTRLDVGQLRDCVLPRPIGANVRWHRSGVECLEQRQNFISSQSPCLLVSDSGTASAHYPSEHTQDSRGL